MALENASSIRFARDAGRRRRRARTATSSSAIGAARSETSNATARPRGSPRARTCTRSQERRPRPRRRTARHRRSPSSAPPADRGACRRPRGAARRGSSSKARATRARSGVPNPRAEQRRGGRDRVERPPPAPRGRPGRRPVGAPRVVARHRRIPTVGRKKKSDPKTKYGRLPRPRAPHPGGYRRPRPRCDVRKKKSQLIVLLRSRSLLNARSEFRVSEFCSEFPKRPN